MTGTTVRVGFNLMWLVPGVVGGTEDAAVGLLGAYAALNDPNFLITLYAQPSFCAAYPQLASHFRVVTRRVPGGSKGARVALEATWLSARLRRDRPDVTHHYGGIVPPGSPRPSLLTLHDVQPLESPSSFSSTKARWLSVMIPRSVKAASVVSVPSRFVRDRLIELIGVDPAKVSVKPHGMTIPTSGSLPDGRRIDEMKQRYRIDRPFLLFPAITYPHKNHVVLLQAFARFCSQHDESVLLVLTGGQGTAEAAVAETAERLGIARSVRRVGRVPWPDLVALYASASGLVFPSRYEGLGLPVVQAMMFGCPVVAANATALPEVVGSDGRLVDPDDVEGWADAMAAVFHDEAATRAMVDSARRRASSMSWQNVAPLTLELYRDVMTQQRGNA